MILDTPFIIIIYLVCALLFSDSIFYTFSFVKQIYETENQRKGDTSLRDGFGSVISVVTDYTEEEGRSGGSNPLQGQFLANGPLQSQQTISSSKCHLLSIYTQIILTRIKSFQIVMIFKYFFQNLQSQQYEIKGMSFKAILLQLLQGKFKSNFHYLSK